MQRRSQRGLPVLQPPYGHDLHGARAKPGYRREEEEEGKEGLEEEEEEASPGFVADQASFLINTSGCLFAASADADADSDSEAVSGLPLPHTRDYIGDVLERGFTLNLVGNRLFYAGVPLLLWIFGPLLAFLSSMVMIPILYSLDVVNLRGHSGCVVSGKSAEMNGSDCTHVV